VQDGLIEKVSSETDRRMVRLSLTPLGEQRVHDLNGTLTGLPVLFGSQIARAAGEGKAQTDVIGMLPL